MRNRAGCCKGVFDASLANPCDVPRTRTVTRHQARGQRGHIAALIFNVGTGVRGVATLKADHTRETRAHRAPGRFRAAPATGVSVRSVIENLTEAATDAPRMQMHVSPE